MREIANNSIIFESTAKVRLFCALKSMDDLFFIYIELNKRNLLKDNSIENFVYFNIRDKTDGNDVNSKIVINALLEGSYS